eukprot:1139943-Pelagomonas_calceolata.AAC.4
MQRLFHAAVSHLVLPIKGSRRCSTFHLHHNGVHVNLKALAVGEGAVPRLVSAHYSAIPLLSCPGFKSYLVSRPLMRLT